MVDVGDKPITTRVASASAKVLLGKRAFDAVQKDGVVGKGNVLAVAQIAGINAAKRASSLIPLCHTLLLHKVSVDFTLHPGDHSVRVLTSAKTDGRTGVEMEALTEAAVAGLTVYDMCKALSKDIVLSDVRLESKSGGVNSGDYVRGGGGGGSS
jgi:cyclic pyranopterin phosphate synthase